MYKENSFRCAKEFFGATGLRLAALVVILKVGDDNQKSIFATRKDSLWGIRITTHFVRRDPVSGGETIKNPFSLRENFVFF